MAFEEQYSEWIARHLASRQGERARRLEEGHGHAESLFVEKVWWPSFWSLDHLHPEYEVTILRTGIVISTLLIFVPVCCWLWRLTGMDRTCATSAGCSFRITAAGRTT